jgi:MFS family permease
MFLLSQWSGGLIGRFGARGPLTIGPSIAALGFALAALPSIGGSYWTTFFPAVMVLGIGMAISVAPLTTAVMNAVPVAQSGIASGINNAISRVASLLAVAVFGLVLLTSFLHDLSRRLDQLALPAPERQSIEKQRLRLAAIQTDDPRIEYAVDEAFVFGFRRILWLAAGLSLAGAACAQVLTQKRGSPVSETNPQVGS